MKEVFGVMNSTNNSTKALSEEPYRITLVTIYTIALLGGSVGICLLFSVLKSNLQTITTIAVTNLLVVHSIFLLTVPFRIYYYVTNIWNLHQGFCKMVSGMIHGHMYIAFLFYTIILGIRYHTFCSMGDEVQFYRKLHVVLASLIVWALGLLIGFPVIDLMYGSNTNSAEKKCFNFGKELQASTAAAVLNYLGSVVIIATIFALTCCQGQILWRIFRQYGADTHTRQEFGVQKKNLCFLLVMILCFLPYHLFRFYYISHSADFENENEVLLAFTALSCFDSLIFLERNSLCA
ncbi:probable G-protein coupled receptor 141 [Brienomyrus brachyistius]|uniref:probable G-protein coupled receptor 141 n=1 Tax=Brienomyrus brachyistius TaxID=42636 RepID=UPI0020B317FD|nr:probable G-protein coupled receptor 141 [Brienomyrus brachyistius]XP_048833129.1 probable G-protein coupled receptor 141 [Brienomyrus brachyistius]XP_048833130.1 probable G-protein coupled receptor 141 [Brienomyrus brachyistius]XP_048833131.1 probable G-protein coupled receptor 141 [Brienomyrus brachyistius]XP_048833132.1 probable G-protein coupled receptor 141 [Brienomyrus brachyistius]